MTSIMENKKERKKLPYWAIIFWLLVWQLVSSSLNQEILLVSPFRVLLTLIELLQTSTFYLSIFLSISRILLGFLCAVIIGTLGAIFSYRHRLVEQLLAPLIYTIRSIPVASFIILILVWVPSRNLSYAIAFLMAFPIIYENIFEGLKQCNPQLLEMAKVFRISKQNQIKTIWISEVLPYFRSGTITALGLCWKAGIAAEVIGLPKHSIGEHLYEAKVYLDTPNLFAWTVVIVLISVFFQKVLVYLLNKLITKIESETFYD